MTHIYKIRNRLQNEGSFDGALPTVVGSEPLIGSALEDQNQTAKERTHTCKVYPATLTLHTHTHTHAHTHTHIVLRPTTHTALGTYRVSTGIDQKRKRLKGVL